MDKYENSALIVIDCQKDFINNLDKDMNAYEAVGNIARVLKFFRQMKIPIIHFRELHRPQLVDFGRELDGDEGIHCYTKTQIQLFFRH